TLLAMVLAIGLVVDDAIVVLENIFRHIEDGMAPMAAAIKGTAEIGFAVIAMTLTLAAVYAPVAFAPGRTGRLFLEFALTLAGSVLVSGFVALTLTPMMCSKLLRHNPKPGRLFVAIERGFTAFERGYRRALVQTLRIRYVVISAALALAGLGGLFLYNLKSELAPIEDRGVLQIRASAPEGATLAFTNRYALQIGKLLEEIPEVQSRLLIVGSPEVTDLTGTGRLKDWDDRSRKQQSLGDLLKPKLDRIPGVTASINHPPSLGVRASSRPIEFVIQTSAEYSVLDGYVNKVLDRLEDHPILTSIESDLKLNKPEFTVELDRQKVADLGLDVAVVGRPPQSLPGGRQGTPFQPEGKHYDSFVPL